MGGNSFFGHAAGLLIGLLILQFSTQTTSSWPAETSSPLPGNADTEYIKKSCNTTLYPSLCYRSLSIYASKIQTDPKALVDTALNVTLKSTKSTYRLVRKISKLHDLNPKVAAAVADCVEEVDDSVYELQRSIDEMGQISAENFYMTIADVQTWVSAALTDDDTCMDGFADTAMNGNVNIVMRRHILRIAHLTSNALALINMYASSQS